jgi:proteasome-associated ATPase
VIVIGASNRQDLIDPAVLRPGRLDLKIKVQRPDADAAGEIFSKYLTTDLPFHDESRKAYGEDAKKMAIKEHLETGTSGLRVSHLMAACLDEFKENEDLPNTTNPDDWARISGRKGERIINVRTLMTGISRKERSIENITSGQYL